MKRILLVEDEEHLHDVIKMNLEMEEYDVTSVYNGKKAIDKFKGARFDLVILDVMLPEVNGFDICRTIRISDANVPILFLSAKSASTDKIEGLKLGADDYLTKPFNLEELLLRVNILIQRSGGNAIKDELNTYEIEGRVIDFNQYIVTHGDKNYDLRKKEALLLKLLIGKKNEVVSREYILETIWGFDVYPTTRTIDNYILSYRKIFEEDSRNPKYFHSIRGVGYKFTP